MNPPPVTTAPTTAAFPHVSMSASLGGNARISISLAVVGVIIADHLAVLLILLGHGGGSNQGWERAEVRIILVDFNDRDPHLLR